MENPGTRHISQRRLAYSRSGNRFVSNSISFILSAGPVQHSQNNAPRFAATWIPQVDLAHRCATASLSRAATFMAGPRTTLLESCRALLSLEPLSTAKWLARPPCHRPHRPVLALSAKMAPESAGVRQWHAAAVGSARQNVTILCLHRRPMRCSAA